MAQLRVFVSHSSSDKPFADALVAALRQAGADVWYDEHNLGAGQLLADIQRELATRPAFVVVLSKAAFASEWVQQETQWAWNLYRREPQRIILPVVAQPIEPSDFNTMLFLEDFKRVEGPGNRPYPQAEAVERTLRLLELTPASAAPKPAVRPVARPPVVPSVVPSVRPVVVPVARPAVGTTTDDLIAHGKALSAQQRYAEAIPFFEVATQLAPGNFDAWFNLGLAHNLSEHWQEALAAYERALAINLNDATAWNNKGKALNGLSRYKEALEAYEWAIAINPKYAHAWRNKAISLRAWGRKAEAQEAERRAQELGGSG